MGANLKDAHKGLLNGSIGLGLVIGSDPNKGASYDDFFGSDVHLNQSSAPVNQEERTIIGNFLNNSGVSVDIISINTTFSHPIVLDSLNPYLGFGASTFGFGSPSLAFADQTPATYGGQSGWIVGSVGSNDPIMWVTNGRVPAGFGVTIVSVPETTTLNLSLIGYGIILFTNIPFFFHKKRRFLCDSLV
jgi:hypothetical protein